MKFNENEIKNFFNDYQTRGRYTENTKYKKVIFLDVDGVLTSDTSFKLKINDERMARLKRIIDATNADVVLSSSRRRSYIPYLKHPNDIKGDVKRDMDHFQEMLDKYNITISDYTIDVGYKGYTARPYEIRTWLLDKFEIKSFVILDDENWVWNWMEKFVVKTAREVPEDDDEDIMERIYGLEDEHVERAIEILNGKKQKEDSNKKRKIEEE